MSHPLLNDVRSEALFASPLQQADNPTAAEIRAAVIHMAVSMFETA